MTAEKLYALLGEVDDNLIAGAETYRYAPKVSKKTWVSLAALAACLCLVISLWPPAIMNDSAAPMSPEAPGAAATPETPMGPTQEAPSTTPAHPEEVPQTPAESELLPRLTVDGVTYVLSEHLTAITLTQPEGFTYTGESSQGPYYTSPDHPLWVYVLQTVTTDGTCDPSGTMTPIDPQPGYVRYVADWLRSADLVWVEGQLYCHANSYFDRQYSFAYGKLPWADYDALLAKYGLRIEGDAPNGFVKLGDARFIGTDTLPQGELSSNVAEAAVYANPAEPDLVLVENTWHSAKGEHRGFDVYLKWDVPAA